MLKCGRAPVMERPPRGGNLQIWMAFFACSAREQTVNRVHGRAGVGETHRRYRCVGSTHPWRLHREPFGSFHHHIRAVL